MANILVVEDEKAMQDIIADYMRMKGFPGCWRSIIPGPWFWMMREASFFRADCRRSCPGGTQQQMWQNSAGGIWEIIRSMCRSILRGCW